MNCDDWRHSADRLLDQCRLVEALDKYGEAHLHGSYQLDLMTWPEIDVWVFADHFHPVLSWELVGDLAKAISPTMVLVANQLDHAATLNPPNTILVDYRFVFEDVVWKLDICIGSRKDHPNALNYLDAVLPKLTPKTKATIRKLKELFTDSASYRKGRWGLTMPSRQFQSIDIYSAVLKQSVATPSEFVDYLFRERKIDLSGELPKLLEP